MYGPLYNLCLTGCIATKKERYLAIKVAKEFSQDHINGENT